MAKGLINEVIISRGGYANILVIVAYKHETALWFITATSNTRVQEQRKMHKNCIISQWITIKQEDH